MDTDLRKTLLKHAAQQTVLGVLLPVLVADRDSRAKGVPFGGLTQKEIEEGFRAFGQSYLKSDFHPTYIQRRLGPKGLFEVQDDRYRIRQDLLAGATADQLTALIEELDQSLRGAYEARQAMIQRLEALGELPDNRLVERHEAIDSFLKHLSGNRGETFEVVSFAVLKAYFAAFGFELKRFSTVHANDGGMDFVASNAIYQVTIDESPQKVKRDLQKLPGVQRVLVRPTPFESGDLESSGEVLETIDLSDLLDHFLAWLMSRDDRANKSSHMQVIIGIALDEFRRENRAEVLLEDNDGGVQRGGG